MISILALECTITQLLPYNLSGERGFNFLILQLVALKYNLVMTKLVFQLYMYMKH